MPLRKQLRAKWGLTKRPPHSMFKESENLQRRVGTKKKSTYSSSEDEEDVRYFYCNHLFSESTEGWVQCPACSHCSCAGVEDDDEDVRFVCERCAVDQLTTTSFFYSCSHRSILPSCLVRFTLTCRQNGPNRRFWKSSNIFFNCDLIQVFLNNK